MNTISKPPTIKRISGPKRFLGVLVGITGGLSANVLLAYSVSSFYTRNTKFVPYDASSPDLTTSVFRAHNPNGNPPGCIDHAIKQIPYGKLPEKYWVKGDGGRISVDQPALTTDFCRGIWSGVAFRVQRRLLEKWYRNVEGRDSHLWDVKELAKSEYGVGTKIVDHFEVVEHKDDKVRTSGDRIGVCSLTCHVSRSSFDAATHHTFLNPDPQTVFSLWRFRKTMLRRWLPST